MPKNGSTIEEVISVQKKNAIVQQRL